jgi:hypothetical protein
MEHQMIITTNILRSAAWVITATFGLSACAALNDNNVKTLPVTEIYSAAICNINEQGITSIKNKEALQSILKKANSHRLNTKPKEISAIDFNSSQVYLIAMGSRPNSGYALKLTSHEASVKNDVINLPIQVELPSPNGMYAQMMTSPCALISLPIGTYDTINIEGWDALK